MSPSSYVSFIHSLVSNDAQSNFLHTSKEDKFQGSWQKILQGAESHGLRLLLGNSKGTSPFFFFFQENNFTVQNK